MKKRVVVKIGSSSLTDTHGGLCDRKLSELASGIAYLKQHHHDVVLISSGAVAAGFRSLGYPARPVTIEGKQAAAAVGQGLLIQAYTKLFKQYEIVTAQLLLTRSNFRMREQYSNVYNTLDELLKRNVLPIINENDSVAVDELTFGDNDRLSALVSGLVHADYLVMLTDVDGIYEDNPRYNPQVRRYDFLERIKKEHFLSTENNKGSKFGTGGMKSKLAAAQIALSLGVNVFIGKGSRREDLVKIIHGNGDGTYVGNQNSATIKKQKQWIAFHSEIAGRIMIDEGAARAILYNGKSLLPAGINDVQGNFQVGDVVEVINGQQKTLAKGIVNFSSDELAKMKSQRSVTKMQRRSELIHRDQLVLNIEEDEV